MRRGLRIGLSAVAGLAAVLALALIAAWLSGVFASKTGPGRTVDEAPVEAVGPAVEVERRIVPRITRAVGTIRAVHETAVGSRLLAHVERVTVTAGQPVARGDVLVELDKADIEAQVRQVSASLDAAVAREARAKNDFDRLTELRARNAASQQELNDAQRAHEEAAADVEAARQVVEEARAQLGHATVRSPIDGVVIDKHMEAGDLAQPGQTLVTLYEPGKLQLVAAVPERLALGLNVGDDVDVEVEALGLRCTGRISEIVPQASPASRSLDIKVTGPCPPGVMSGMFGRLLIPEGQRTQLLVPRTAVRRVGQLEFVLAVVGGGDARRTERRFVRTGEVVGAQVEVLSGLAAGELVVAHFGETGDG